MHSAYGPSLLTKQEKNIYIYIYIIDLLKSINLALRAWDKVQSSTLKHCWNHTSILPMTASTQPTQPPTDATTLELQACNIIHRFATTSMEIPEAVDLLEQVVGLLSSASKWIKALDNMAEFKGDAEMVKDYMY